MRQTTLAQRLLLIGTVLSTLFLLNNLDIANAQTEMEAPLSEDAKVVRDSAVGLVGGMTLP